MHLQTRRLLGKLIITVLRLLTMCNCTFVCVIEHVTNCEGRTRNKKHRRYA